MIQPFGKWEDQAFAVARFVIGALYACHGAQKLFGVLGGAKELHDRLGLTAGIIEFFGGAMIALALAAGVAAFVASGEMAVAYFMAHASHGFWPIRNGGERADQAGFRQTLCSHGESIGEVRENLIFSAKKKGRGMNTRP